MLRLTPKNLLHLKHYLTRRKRALGYYSSSLGEIERWSSSKTEFSNFYYALEDSNQKDLAMLLAHLFKTDYEVVMSYFHEIQNNSELRLHIKSFFEQNSNLKDSKIEYARRIGWYAIARIIKPRTIVETGVAHGMGSCIMSLALSNNCIDGFQGRYYGTDIDSNAGALYTPPYSNFGEIIYGDSIETLSKFDFPIDLFINDSDHSFVYEKNEYETINKHLGAKSVILGDNSHVSESLRVFSLVNGRGYVFFREAPKDHWYPGAGIGISF